MIVAVQRVALDGDGAAPWTFTCSDALSGVFSCPAAGESPAVAHDRAGNTAVARGA